MLKHKLKKTTDLMNFSRKNGEKKKNSAKDALYAKVRKSQSRKSEVFGKEKLSSSINDGGYFTGPESFYEIPETPESKPNPDKPKPNKIKEGVERGSEAKYKEIQQQPVTYFMPVPVVWCRRASPQEDFLWTSQGIENLVIQQQHLVNNISVVLKQSAATNQNCDKANNENKVKDRSTKTSAKSDEFRQRKGKPDSHETSCDSNELPESFEASSMGKLRRLLEIEEMRKFSSGLEAKIR